MTSPGALLEGQLLDLIEFEPHQSTLRSGSSDAAETEILERFLPTEERVRGLTSGSCEGPNLDSQGTFASS